MKIDVAKIISLSEVEAILMGKEDGHPENIALGEVADLTSSDFGVINLIEEWVRRIDQKIYDLKRIEQLSNVSLDQSYFKMLSHERAVTFNEYQEIFYTSISGTEDIQWIRYPGFRFFNIITERQRLHFTTSNTQDGEGYIQAIKKANLSIMGFFLGGSIKAKAPLNDLFAHTHILAPSGWGKSELMKALFYELATKYPKYSFIVIDPHGKLAEEIKRLHFCADKERVIYVHPFFKEGFFPCFNVFDM